MKLGIMNSELGISVVEGLEDLDGRHLDKIKSQMPEGAQMEDMVFFYMDDRDCIVINRSHKLYEYYAQIIQIYLELSEVGRKKSAEDAPTEAVREAFRILDGVIRRRRLIQGIGGDKVCMN